jgi:NTP pyrophosphatase (non-canonical NTP hydrolase)
MTNKTIFSVVWESAKLADKYHNTRTMNTILNHAMSEMGETAEEINIVKGEKSQPGPDGVIGEALDTIAALLDLIYVVNPNLTEKQLVQIIDPFADNETMYDMVWNEEKNVAKYHGVRNDASILNYAMCKMGELAIEVNIANGASYKKPSTNGVIGKAMHTNFALMDLIHCIDPTLIEAELIQKLEPKMGKWIAKIKEHSEK